jgi:cytidylate kinase
VAELVAERLGYECLSRSLLLEASEQYGVPELKLSHALHDAPSLLERLGHRQAAYVAVVQSALARHVARDDVVYHGHAGHVLLKNVSHVLKVRIVASLELRTSMVMRDHNLAEADARHEIEKIDRGRAKWTRTLYRADPNDATFYDLVLHIPRFTVSDATDLICQCARLKQFATTQSSRRAMQDLVLASEVKARLAEEFPDVAVTSRGGNVLVYCAKGERHGRRVRARAQEICKALHIENIEVHVGASPPESAV